MSRKKLGIVSSYGVHCGNASYTHVLKEEFSKYYDVDVIPVNFRLLANAHPKVRGSIKHYIRELCGTIAQYDYINIQFEAALFGHSIQNACKNVIPMIRAARNLSFTIHRPYNPTVARPLWKSCLKNGVNVMQTLRDYNYILQYKAFTHLMQVLAARNAKGCSAVAIVHTQREKELLQIYYNIDKVVDFPITFLNRQQIDAHRNNRAHIREKICAKYKLDPAAKYIGIFGFLAENKAHHVAVDALRFLPDEYNLLIFGVQHPLAINEYSLMHVLQKPKSFRKNSNAYIASLIELAEDVNARHPHRVRFMGDLNDSNFIDALAAMDFVVLPYYETGQSGSGNASLVLEVGTKAIFARNHAFMELARYYQDCFEFADIGNALEIAQRIEFWNRDFSENQMRGIAKYNIENNILIQKTCFEEGPQAAEKLKQELLK
jgi:glycosyltransferase involved in cell wall biosynthesis